MKKLTLFLLCILHCALCIDLKAQANDSVSELRLSLAEARDYAIEHNRTLQNAGLSVRQAYATRWQTIASMLPQADMSLGLNYTDGKMKFALQDGMPPMEREIENLAGLEILSESTDEPKSWFVMRDLKRPNAHLPGYKLLESLGVTYYTPMHWVLTTRGAQKKREYRPFIPDLLFVHETRQNLDAIVSKTPTLQTPKPIPSFLAITVIGLFSPQR